MAKFKVVQYRDACVVYECWVEAKDAEEAFYKARDEDQDWVQGDVCEYDDADAEVQNENGETVRDSRHFF